MGLLETAAGYQTSQTSPVWEIPRPGVTPSGNSVDYSVGEEPVMYDRMTSRTWECSPMSSRFSARASPRRLSPKMWLFANASSTRTLRWHSDSTVSRLREIRECPEPAGAPPPSLAPSDSLFGARARIPGLRRAVSRPSRWFERFAVNNAHRRDTRPPTMPESPPRP